MDLMAKSITFLIFIFGLCAANVFSQSQTIALRKAQALCDRIAKIKQLPHHYDEKGVDTVYDAIAEAGEAVIPCLIERLLIQR
jgi:hypothetical protein